MPPDAIFEIDTIQLVPKENTIIVTIELQHPPEVKGQKKAIPIRLSSQETRELEHRMRGTIQSIYDEILRQYLQGPPSEFLGEIAPE